MASTLPDSSRRIEQCELSGSRPSLTTSRFIGAVVANAHIRGLNRAMSVAFPRPAHAVAENPDSVGGAQILCPDTSVAYVYGKPCDVFNVMNYVEVS